MTIDFHSADIRGTYAARAANEDWVRAISAIVVPSGASVADIGCGGGIYSRAWKDAGAADVIGVDFSAQMVADAAASSAGYRSLRFVQGDATATTLPDASRDIVFERALIHHLPDLSAAFREAFRILRPGGNLIVQDRTMDDVLRPSSPEHLRGFFFEAFPRLLDVERERRPDAGTTTNALIASGFSDVTTMSIAETRQTYNSLGELQDDLRARTGRSILHALSDEELERLVETITTRVVNAFPLKEFDFWTAWIATKPE